VETPHPGCEEMQDTIREAKRALRQRVCAELGRLGPAERAAASAQARARLAAQPLWQTAQWVLFFAPLPEELDLWPLLTKALSASKNVALPRFVAETRTYEVCPIQDPELDLQVGHFGIREPSHHCRRLPSVPLDLILVPGVAFDARGGRLGRGKGYYDRLLKEWRGTTCGVAFDQQVVEAIPCEPHDARLDCVLTPTRWIERKA
jgi:5-formyltetrahydrofolate cyclo-ligase